LWWFTTPTAEQRRSLPKGSSPRFKRNRGRISTLYARENIAISDYKPSLQRDIRLIRESKGTLRNVNIYGLLFDVDTESLTLVVEDPAPLPAAAALDNNNSTPQKDTKGVQQ
jgi:hypothetical protein